MKRPAEQIEELRREIERACANDERFRDCVPVFGTGPVPSRLMVIGEAPGRDETRLRTPFVGKAGSFFVNILSEAIGRDRQEVYITNVLKVWPVIATKRLKTRKPLQEEEEFFLPFLKKEIEIVDPAVILAVGKTAFSALRPDDDFVPGRFVEFTDKVRIMPVYHPSYLLRRQKSLKEGVVDLKKALAGVKSSLRERD